MATLISIEDFRERFDIDDDIDNRRLEPHIGSASRRLRKWVTDTTYAAAVAEAISEDDDTDLVNDLKNAEACLAMHFAILGLNTPFSAKGIVAMARTSESGREIRQYLTPDQTAALSTQYLEQAREIAEPYITADANLGFEIVESEINTDLPWLP